MNGQQREYQLSNQYREKKRLSSIKGNGNGGEESETLRNNLNDQQLAMLANPILKNHICAEHIDNINTNEFPVQVNVPVNGSNGNQLPSNGGNGNEGSNQSQTQQRLEFDFPEYKITHLN